jgi:tRNA(fMet)-specific endonuclease VapC
MIDAFASVLAMLPYDARAAAWHTRERARLARRGKASPFVDGQVAAIPAVNDLVLVTRNLRDFGGFAGLNLESWFTA